MRESNLYQDEETKVLRNRSLSGKRIFWTFILAIILSIGIIIPMAENFYTLQGFVNRFLPQKSLNYTAGRIGVDKLKEYKAGLVKENAKLSNSLENFIPKQNYLIINTSGNDFVLMNKQEVIRKGKCSTGSYTMLKGKDEKQWVFKTPRGMLKILKKIKDPVWKKPDWAFIEEGLPVPSSNHPSRYETGTLGDYSLHLGDGYMIHGTLYKRFLGMPVTHGCIRMGDEDLETVFNALPMGSKVYIY